MTRYLSTEHVLLLYQYVVEQSGGLQGLRDRGLLESALAQPQMAFGGEELYPTLPEKTAALGFALIKNHAFLGGAILKRCWYLVVSCALLLGACATPVVPPPTPPTATISQQLRVENVGSTPITGLVVLFPGSTAEAAARRVPFGDLAAGATSAYQDVPGGVYRYAAYEYRVAGRVVTQFVMDWMGEQPMAGQRFTYRIALDPQRVQGDQIQLIEVLPETP